MPTARASLAAATGADGRIYALGGISNNSAVSTAEAHDPATNSWTTLAPMPTARENLAAATGPDGRIYAIGGNTPFTSALATVEAYDPATNSWATLAPMPTAREGLAAVTAPDGRIYALGGGSGGSALATVEAYDPATNSWATLAPMPTARFGLAAAMGFDGRIYAFGGLGFSFLNTAEAYDPATNSWTSVAPMPTARTYLAAATGPDGHIYAIGGDDGSNDLATAEAYTSAASTSASWICSTDDLAPGCTANSLAPMSTGRDASAAATGPDGRIYILGGNGINGFLASGEAYTPAANTWAAVAPMPTAREFLAAATGKDGRIYALGGQGSSGNTIVEAYGVATSTPSATATMLSSSVNPSVVGQAVTYTATVSPAPDGGTVSFADGGTAITGCGAVSVNTSTGIATCSVTYAAVGSHTITASYSGDSNFASSDSTSLVQQVNQASAATMLSSSANPAVVGQQVTLTATVAVTTPGAGAPTGTVSFADGGIAITSCGSRALTSGSATCTVAFNSVGSHTITATYSGDTNFAGSGSASLAQQVNQASTTTSLAVTSPTQPSGLPAGLAISVAGQKVTYTASVSPIPDGGLLTFKDGATTLCSNVPLSPSGTATCSKTYSAAGLHSITATYSGNANVKSSSANLTLYVNTNISRYLKNGVYNLSRLNLAGGYFVEANLSGANLSSGNFSGANFTGANLSGANLTSGNFSGANFTGANLTRANLTRANLKGATGLASATLSGVTWSYTTCPDNTSSNKDGGTCVGHL